MLQSKQGDVSLVIRLLRIGRPIWIYLATFLILNLLAAPLSLLMPVPVKIAVDSVLGDAPLPTWLDVITPIEWKNSPMSLLWLAIVMIFLVAILQQLRAMVASLLRVYCGEKINVLFRAKLFRQAQRLSLAFHDRQGSNETLYRIQYDGIAGQGAIVTGVLPMIGSMVTVIIMLVVILRMDWQLTLVALSVCPVLILTTRFFRPHLRKGWTIAKEAESAVLHVVQETLAMIRIVVAFRQEEREQGRFSDRAQESIRTKLRVVFQEGLFGIIVGLTVAAGTAGALYIGVLHVQNGTLLLGNLLLVMMYLAMLYQPLTALGEKAAAIQGALASAVRAFAMLDEKPDVVEKPNGKKIHKSHGEFEFLNVGFSYDDSPTLQNLNLRIPAGSRVGITGTTGAGKSTFISLLPRFYDPSNGQVLLDGTDLRDYDLADLRDQFGIVLQDTALVSGTIAENIAYGRSTATMSEIVESAKLANAHQFISKFSDSYESQVGERGTKLSGGERQRIALARAFLRNASILILDEPTSSVDVKTEALVLEAIGRLMKGRTTFMISHRPNTLDSCDKRLHFENGRVQEIVKT